MHTQIRIQVASARGGSTSPITPTNRDASRRPSRSFNTPTDITPHVLDGVSVYMCTHMSMYTFDMYAITHMSICTCVWLYMYMYTCMSLYKYVLKNNQHVYTHMT